MTGVFPLGGQRGTHVEVTAQGSDLDRAHGLVFSHPGIVGKPKMKPAVPLLDPESVPGRFVVTISPDVPPAAYEVRVVGRFGVSNPRRFVVGARAEVEEKEGNNTAEQGQVVTLPVVINGRSGGNSDLDYFKFTARKGERLFVECVASQIDSKLDPVLTLTDPRGVEVIRSGRFERGNASLDVTLKHDGDYVLEVRDFLFAGSNDHGYRVAIHRGPRIDFVFPPSAKPGTKTKFTVYGRGFKDAAPVEGITANGRPLQKREIEMVVPKPSGDLISLAIPNLPSSGANLDGFALRLDSLAPEAESAFVGFAENPVHLEKEPENGDSQKVEVPCEVAGQFATRGDVDIYRFSAKKGEAFQIDVVSHRIGVAADPYMIIQSVKGSGDKETFQDIKRIDDMGGASFAGNAFPTANDDPAFRFAVPADGDYRVVVRDLHGEARGHPSLIYRLRIRRDAPDFKIFALSPVAPLDKDKKKNTPRASSLLLRAGATTKVHIFAIRQDGFNEAIDLRIDGLPKGVTARLRPIAKGQTAVDISLDSAEEVADFDGTIQIVGTSKLGDRAIEHRARSAGVTWGAGNGRGIVSRLSDSVRLAVRGFEKDSLGFGLPEARVVSRAGNLKFPVKLLKRHALKGKTAVSIAGLPGNVGVKEVQIDEKKDTVELTITANEKAPPGEYEVFLWARGQVAYRRHVDLADAAKKKHEELAGETKKLDEQATVE
ncbi:MAG: hypothetical protein AAF517_20935, partial [Planctomycetota bacterium]